MPCRHAVYARSWKTTTLRGMQSTDRAGSLAPSLAAELEPGPAESEAPAGQDRGTIEIPVHRREQALHPLLVTTHTSSGAAGEVVDLGLTPTGCQKCGFQCYNVETQYLQSCARSEALQGPPVIGCTLLGSTKVRPRAPAHCSGQPPGCYATEMLREYADHDAVAWGVAVDQDMVGRLVAKYWHVVMQSRGETLHPVGQASCNQALLVHGAAIPERATAAHSEQCQTYHSRYLNPGSYICNRRPDTCVLDRWWN